MKVSKWIRGQPSTPVTHLYTGFYLSNLVKFKLLQKQEDGSLLLNINMPDDAPLPSYAVEQTGGWVLAAFKDKKYIGVYPLRLSEGMKLTLRRGYSGHL